MHNEPVRVKREPTDLIYGNHFVGGKEQNTYFRENSVLLQDKGFYNSKEI